MLQSQADIGLSEYLADILPRRDTGPVRNDGWKPGPARGATFVPSLVRNPSGSYSDFNSRVRTEPAYTRPFNLPTIFPQSNLLPGPGLSFHISAGGEQGAQGVEGPPGPPGSGGGGGILSLDVSETTSPPVGYTVVLSLDVMTDLYLDGSDIKFDTKTVAIYALLDGTTLRLRGVDPTASENVFDDWTDCT